MAGVRRQLRAKELADPKEVNDTLLGIYLRLEALERASDTLTSSMPEIEFASIDFTTGAELETVYPLTVVVSRSFTPRSVRRAHISNLTAPAALFYEAVDIPNWSYAWGVLTIPYVTGLSVLTSYRLVIEMTS